MATRVISLVYDEVEDLEFWYPTLRLREAGAVVDVVGEEAGKKYTGKYGLPAEANLGFDEVDPENYDAILVPGGWAPDKLRRFEAVLTMVRSMNEAQKIIGEICHAGWVLISAGILEGRKVTSTPGIKDDMVNAGAVWLDEAVVVDRNIVSSRRPPDLPEYAKALLKALEL